MQLNKIVLAMLASGAFIFAFASEAREREPPAIRAFDLPTIEKLGHDIYMQDQLAWKATDVLNAERTEAVLRKEGIRGWIVVTVDGKDVVRFVKPGRRPEAAYDVAFTNGADPVVSTPADKALTSEEIAQYNAREMALKNVETPCSDRYNTVVLKDPQGDGWIAWALAATLDPDLVQVGGHYRFTISADGKRVRQRDALSRSCIRFSKKAMTAEVAAKNGTPTNDYFVSQIVSLTPTEGHVFANLNYKAVFRVGTTDGRVWKVDDGHITNIDQDSPDLDGMTARNFAGQSELCTLIVTKTGENPKRYFLAGRGSVKVINPTEREEKFSVSLEPGMEADAVVCGRMDIVPAPNDYKVLRSGLKLSIKDIGTGHVDRSGWLEIIDGAPHFRIRMGRLSMTSSIHA